MSAAVDRGRKWTKRIAWALAILVVARIAIAIAVPIVIRNAASKHDLDCDWDRLRLSLLGGSVELKGLELRPKAPAGTKTRLDPIARVESVDLDLAMLDLLRLHPRVVTAAVDGVELRLSRGESGPWNFERHVSRDTAQQEPPAKPPKDDAQPESYDLALPIEIDALRLHDVVVLVDDRGTTPAVTTRCELNASAWHIGDDERPGRFDVTVTSPGVLDSATIVGELEASEQKARARVEVRVNGLRPRTLAGWLAAAGLEPRAERLSAGVDAELTARTVEGRRELQAGFELRDLRGLVDENEHVALDRLRVGVPSITPARLAFGVVELDGVRLRAEKLANGHLLALGFEIGESPSAEPAPVATESGPATPWTIERITTKELALAFVDRSVEPAANIELAHGAIDIARAGYDPARPTEPMTVKATFDAGGIARSLALHGTVDVFGPKKTVGLELDAQQVTLASVAGHLRALGLEPTLAGGTLKARIDARGESDALGRTRGELHLRDVAFTDASELFALKSIDVTGIDLDPAQDLLRCAAVEIHGTHVPASRDASGAILAFGVRTIPAQPAPAEAKTSQPAARPSATPASAPMRIEIARFAVSENRFDWADDRIQPPVRAVFDDCGLEIVDFGFGGDPALHPSNGAKLKLYSNAADLVTKLDVEGTITTKPGPLDLELQLSGSAAGITIARLQPYLDPTGIHENFVGASVTGRCAAHVREEPSGLVISASADELVFENDGKSIMGLKSLRVDDARIGDTIRVRSVRLDAPRFVARRDPVGALLAAGMRIPVSVFEKGAAVPEASAEPSAPATTSHAEDILAGLPDVAVDEFQITGGVLAWSDESRTPAVAAEARLDLDVKSFATRGAGKPADFQVRIAVPGSAEAIEVVGQAALDPKAATIAARVHAAGLHAGSLATYLPPGVACELTDGQLDFEGRIEIGAHAQGGLAMDARVGPFSYKERDATEPLAAWKEIRCSAKRIDPVELVFDIDTLSSDGITLAARRDANGVMHALGFRVGTEPGSFIDSSRKPLQDAAPSLDESMKEPGSVLRFDRKPTVRVEHLALDLGRVQFRDETQGADAVPLELRAKLTSDGSIDVFNRPVSIALDAAALPIAQTIHAGLVVDVAKDAPSFDLGIGVEGLRGEGLTECMPALAAKIDGSSMTNGRFTTGVHGVLTWKRRGPLDFDLRNGCAAEIRVDPLRFDEIKDGVVIPLAGLDGVEIDVKRFDPAKGVVHVASLDIAKPSGRFSREADGLHAFGLTFKPKPEASPDTGSAPSAETPDRGHAVVAAAPRDRAAGEVRIDSLTMRGLDLELCDASTTPPTLLPLNDLDVEISKFTTRAFTEPRTLRFNAYLGADAVDLRDHTRVGRAVENVEGQDGIVSAARSKALPENQRKVFDEIALSGRLAFYPALEGWAKLDLNTLELLAVSGAASGSGLAIDEGTLDTSVRVRFKGERGATVDSTIVFTDLSLSEPKGGPIESSMHLPMPLDTALFLLENDAGEHRIPIHFDVAADGIGEGEIASAAVGAISSVVLNALASAPLRIVGTFTDLLGLSGGPDQPVKPALVHFAGAAVVAEDAQKQLEPILERLREDSDLVVVLQHRFGRADIERAAVLANPSTADCTAHAARLRQRKAELNRERAELVAEARSEYGVGRDTEALRTSARIRDVDAELARAEALLDKTCELLRPGAERARDKRTKAAALAIARERLSEMKNLLDSSGITDIRERVEMRSATLDVATDDSPGTIVVALKKRG